MVKKLDTERESITHSFRIKEQEFVLTVGLFPDGNPAEIFLSGGKVGESSNTLCKMLGISMSIGLKYGISIEEYIKNFVYVKSENEGVTDDTNIRFAKSMVDYIGKWLAFKFLPKDKIKQYGLRELV